MSEIDATSLIQHLRDAVWCINERKYPAAKGHINHVIQALKTEIDEEETYAGYNEQQICVICGESYPKGGSCSKADHGFVRGLT